MYRAETDGIEVIVHPEFLPDRSDPGQSQYFWAYTVEIVNRSAHEIELKTRHWIITDALGRVQEVRGEGVVGQQPRLPPGERFSYTSGCPLTTPDGTMEGSFGMIDDHGRAFEVAIPLFSLDIPATRRTLH